MDAAEKMNMYGSKSGYRGQDVRNLYGKYAEVRTQSSIAVERGDISGVSFYVTLLWGMWVGLHLDDIAAAERANFFIKQMNQEPTLNRAVKELMHLDALFSQYAKGY